MFAHSFAKETKIYCTTGGLIEQKSVQRWSDNSLRRTYLTRKVSSDAAILIAVWPTGQPDLDLQFAICKKHRKLAVYGKAELT